MTKVKVRNILILILLAFLVWNVSWFLLTTIKYKKFGDAVPKNRFGIHHVKKDGYNYNVKKPGYFSFTGNLGISSDEKMEALIIWPLIFGGYEYGVRVEKDGVGYEIYVDENMEPVDKTNAVTIQKVKEFKPIIEQLFRKANEMWELG